MKKNKYILSLISVMILLLSMMLPTLAQERVIPADDAAEFSLMTSGLSTEALSTTLSAEDLVNLLLTDDTIAVSNVQYMGADSAAGIFSGGTGIIGFETGIVLSSGSIANIIGPNTLRGKTTAHYTAGDAELTALAGVSTRDAAILEFDFIPSEDKVYFNYVFASEEYNEYVGSLYNDVFAFFVNGVNYAVVGDNSDPVSVNTINHGRPGVPPKNPELYINNDPFDPDYDNQTVPTADLLNTEMDGLTAVLTFSAPVNPGEVNRMKLAIADGSDHILDSNVFIQAGTFSVTPPVDPPVDPPAPSVPNYGFIPNSGEASVSKVDLVSQTEVARYYTAPRLNDEVDLLGNPTPGVANTINPYSWRTSRMAIDKDGNAWVLNVGSDGPSNGLTLQGSVVRIQADTAGLITADSPVPLPFGSDEAVQVLPVGNTGDLPRAIAIDSDGYLWVGFYRSTTLMKYAYNEATKSLDPVGGPYGSGLAIRYYEMKFAPNGTLWISSRNSTPNLSPRNTGIWSFNGTDFTKAEIENMPADGSYSLLISGTGQVFATAYNNRLFWRESDGTWESTTIPGTNQNRGMAFDNDGVIWIASTVNHNSGTNIGWYNPLTSDKGFITLNSAVGTTPVGVGLDNAGLMWAVCRSDSFAQGFIQAFDPQTKELKGAIQVGYRPYAYGDFTIQPPPPEIARDTVWAAQDEDRQFGEAGVNRFRIPGNWGTYILQPNAEGVYSYPIYAARWYEVGRLEVNIADDSICVRYTINENFTIDNATVKGELCELHLDIGRTLAEITNRAGNPTPGRFTYTADDADTNGWVCVPLSDVTTDANGNILIAAHGVLGWYIAP